MLEKSIMSASSLTNEIVRNYHGEDLGRIVDIMIDVPDGKIAYAVMSFGGFMHMGNKLFAIPWQALTLDQEEKVFKLNVNEEKLRNSPGFDKDNWPDFADASFLEFVNDYYSDMEPSLPFRTQSRL